MTSGKLLSLLILILLGSIAAYSQSRATVTSGTAAVREKPSSRSKIILTLKKGSALKILPRKRKKNWEFVEVNKRKGWVPSGKIEIIMENPTRKTIWLYIGNSQKTNDFSVRYYLAAASIVPRGDRIYFWTKMTANNKKAYLKYLLGKNHKKDAADFLYNADLWEGDCAMREIFVKKGMIYWRNGKTTRYRLSVSKVNASGNSAARSILQQACRASRR